VPRSRRDVALTAIVACLGLVLALAAGELALRIVGLVSAKVRYLSTAQGSPAPERPATLAAYLASRPESLIPHGEWFNHWTNALGFNDEEFVLPKPRGRFRIMAVGDSYTFGSVPYPESVMTLVESALRTACPGRDLDLLNLGIGATGVRDYRTIVELASATYEPDLVLINFYAGNDGPRRRSRDGRPGRWVRAHSYLWRFTENALRLRRSVPNPDALAEVAGGRAPQAHPAGGPRLGGRVVDPNRRLRDDAPALAGPIFDEEAFTQILAGELRQLHVPEEPGGVGQAWTSTLEELEAARVHVARHGGRLVITVYPSALQIDTPLRATLVDRLRSRRRHADLRTGTIDPTLPNRMVLEYCRSRGLACFDLTPALVRASEESADPVYKARDAHWTIRGNRVAAAAQAAYLAPLVCKTSALPRRTAPSRRRSSAPSRGARPDGPA
jgi:hypothetical protein